MNATPRVIDNDRDEITVTLDGKEIRGWSYADEAERRVKMRAAREFVEGWHAATERAAGIADDHAHGFSRQMNPTSRRTPLSEHDEAVFESAQSAAVDIAKDIRAVLQKAGG